MTAATASVTHFAPARILHGVLGGLTGGVVFGMLMQMMGMIPMVAMMVGSESVAVGWLVHLAISAVIGVSFAVLFGGRVSSWGTGLLYGVGYGVVWWVLGALIAMPAKLGMPIFAFNTTAWQSLMGHMIFGAILGAVVVRVGRHV